MTDSLTAAREELLGSPDRRLMQHAIESARGGLSSGAKPAAVLLIEVRGLDAGGEQAAASLAARVAAAVDPDDLVGRFGGDVLVVVSRDVADEWAAHALASHLVDLIRSSPDPGSRHVIAGVAIVRDSDTSVAAVVARADAALYAAKNKARRDARGDASDPRDGSREELVEAAFDRSTVEDFDVYYQPIVDVRDGSIVAVEAILRWEHPDLGTIAPGEFLAIVEHHGQMVRLGRWTIDKACAQTVRWGATRDGLPMRTCVNVGAAQVADPAFVEDVMSALARHGAAAHQLGLELAEDALASVPADLHATLAGLRLGMILDHAGTRPPSRELLERMALSMVKFDRSLVEEDSADGPSSALRLAAQLARDLSLPCVAKGVETRTQLQAVRDCGVPYAQGYLFTRPKSAAAIEELVYRERPFGSLLAPPPLLLGLELDGEEPAVELGAPAVP
jgi:EAL domain-containing protein (putative c-di-GMP-specific phosphodiesterase class I)